MLQLAKELNCEKQLILGYRDSLFLKEEFKKSGSLYVATEDGSYGTEGNVLDVIRENGLDAEHSAIRLRDPGRWISFPWYIGNSFRYHRAQLVQIHKLCKFYPGTECPRCGHYRIFQSQARQMCWM